MENEVTTQAAEKVGILETQTCTRCHGSGQYSYCPGYGTTCFKCAGTKETLTKRGVMANRYLLSLRSKSAGELKVGEVIWSAGVPGHIKSGWHTIKEILPYEDKGRYVVNGVEQPKRIDLIEIKCPVLHMPGVSPEQVIRVRQDKEQSAATWAKAMAYQATLSKMGKPTKKTEALLAA